RAVPEDKLELADGVLLHASAALVNLHSGQLDAARQDADRATDVLARVPAYVTEHQCGIVWLMEVYVELWRQAVDQRAAVLERAALRSCKHARTAGSR